MSSGTTIEYSVAGEDGDCCLSAATGQLPALSMEWRDNGNGTYTMTSATQYSSPGLAQTDCCRGIS